MIKNSKTVLCIVLCTIILWIQNPPDILAKTGRLENVFATVSGTVTDAQDGTGMAGVSIAIKGTGQGTVTDENGFYSLDNVEASSVLVFSMIVAPPRTVDRR